MLCPLGELSETSPPFPAIIHESRDVPKARHTFIDIGDAGEVHVITTRHELDPQGATHLTAETRRNLRKNHWTYTTSGLAVPASDGNAATLISRAEYIVSDKMDHGRPVVIIDGFGVLLVAVDSDLLTEDGAYYMGEAVRDYMSGGSWVRDTETDLWLPSDR